MQTVFKSNSDCFHKFAQQSQIEGRANNVSFHRNKAYSYSQCIGNIIDNYIFLINWNYSPTTSKHNSILRSATSQYIRIYIAYPQNPKSPDNISNFFEDFETLKSKFVRARKKDVYISEMKMFQDNVAKYIEATNYHDDKRLTEIINFEFTAEQIALAEKQVRAARQRKLEKTREQIEKFHNFRLNSFYGSEYSYLRLNGSMVETSQAVKVELRIIKPLIEIYKIYLSGNEKMKLALIGKHINSFTIREVNHNFVQIGCHKIKKDEILNLLK